MRQQQVCSLNGAQQIFIAVAHKGKEHFVQEKPAARLWIHDFFHHHRILLLRWRQVRAYWSEFEAAGEHLFAIQFAGGNYRLMAAGA